jgi:hypothetical protein
VSDIACPNTASKTIVRSGRRDRKAEQGKVFEDCAQKTVQDVLRTPRLRVRVTRTESSALSSWPVNYPIMGKPLIRESGYHAGVEAASIPWSITSAAGVVPI